MSVLSKVSKGRKVRPRRTIVYGVHGVGKSTFAADWPSPLFIPTEDGISDLDVDSLPVCVNAMQVYEAAMELSSEATDHDYKTVVIDSADWLEQLIWRDLCLDEGKDSIADFGFGKGYSKSAERFRKILSALDGCRDRGLHVLLIAHCEVKRFENPEGDSYDRYTPKLHKTTEGLIQEWADEVLFATYKTFVRKNDEGFGKERGVGVGTGERTLKTNERPSHLAKNRLGLPDEIPMRFEEYAKFLPGGGNISGKVVNGSSKKQAV